MMLHGPSIGVGAAISAVVILGTFFVFEQFFDDQVELQPVQIPTNKEKIDSLSIFFDNGSPILGNPDARVTLVEFGDFQCFFCNKFFHNTEETLFNEYVNTGKVRVIFKDFTIIGPDSVTASHGAHCANEQGKFWEYHDILYTNWAGENNGWASSENLLKFAEEIELDISQWETCMKESRYQNIIIESNQDAQTLGLSGTPAFFVIGPDNHVTKIEGAQPYDVFKRVFEIELAK